MATVGPIKWISELEVRKVLTWDVLVPEMSELLQKAVPSENDLVQPLRTRVHNPENDGVLMVMPSLVKSKKALSTKLLTHFVNNDKLGVPSHNSVVLLNDYHTGLPLALLEGDSITELRTAAASAAATLAIRKNKEGDANPVVAVLGSGVQGVAHCRVMNFICKPREIRLWSRSDFSKVASTLISEGIPIISCKTVEEALSGASIINTCTNAAQPIVKKEWVTQGAHINSVGASRSTHQELESDLVLSSVIYADSKEAALAEAGDIIISGAEVTAEIGEIIKGSLSVPSGETTIFKSLGMGAEDAVSAKLVYDLTSNTN